MIAATAARIPGFDAFVGTISIAPHSMSGATSRRLHVGRRRSKNAWSSGLFSIVRTVAVTTRRSTPAARAIAVSEIRISPAYTRPSWTRRPVVTMSWATFSCAGNPLKADLKRAHMAGRMNESER